jgi:signal peptidase I
VTGTDEALDDPMPSVAPPKRSAGRRAVRWTIEWIAILGAALAVAFLLKTFFVQTFYIPSESMDPTLRVNDRILVNKVSYRLHEIHRGDIVVFERPDCDLADPQIKDLVKRVVAFGGESVEARDGRLLVNGRVLREPYLPTGVATVPDFGPVEIPAEHVWVMGDNRTNSKDSRYLCNSGPTPIAVDDVVGRFFLKIWPLPRSVLLGIVGGVLVLFGLVGFFSRKEK